jgi:uncharacterized protein YciI
MYAWVILRYRKPLEEVVKVTGEHRAYLQELKAKGILVASGPFDPRTGGGLLVRVSDENPQKDLDDIRNGDPFWKTGTAQHELLVWNPVIGKEDLDRL